MSAVASETKFVELLVHAVEELGEQVAGMSTKLNKILYFCDFAHVRRTGDPITGFEYQKLPHGPAPRALVPVRDQLISNGTLAMRATTDAFGYNHHVFTASRSADLSVFSDLELATINSVVDAIVGLSAREVSDLSHQDAGWQMARIGESIPYSAAYLGINDELPERLRQTVEASAENIEAKLGHRLAR